MINCVLLLFFLFLDFFYFKFSIVAKATKFKQKYHSSNQFFYKS